MEEGVKYVLSNQIAMEVGGTTKEVELLDCGDILKPEEGSLLTEETPNMRLPPNSVVAFKLTLTFGLVLASLFVNIVVFVIFSSRPALLSVSNKLVLHLAVCNFILTLGTAPMLLNGTLVNTWRFGWLACNISGCVLTSLIAVSSMTLLCISIDRYHAIVHPLRYARLLTTRRTYKCIMFIWGVCLTFSLFSLTQSIDYDHQLSICFIDLTMINLFTRVYIYLFSFIFFVVPLGCMLVVYLKIFGAAKRSTANARRNSLNPDQPKQVLIQYSPSPDRTLSANHSSLVQRFYHKLKVGGKIKNPMLHKDDFKAAITGFLCVTTFTISWIPFFSVLTLKVTRPGLLQDWVEASVVYVALTSCIFNPCLYVFRSQLVRREVDSYLRRRSSVDVTAISTRRISAANTAGLLPKITRHQSEPCTHSQDFNAELLHESYIPRRNFRSISVPEGTNTVIYE